MSGLRQASWRGVPFAIEQTGASVGRRLARHDYPYRDDVWLEDQGKLPPTFRVSGFLIGNSGVYGGGDVQSQFKHMQAACEATGQGVFVHPSRGRLTVNLVDAVLSENWEESNVIRVDFTFVQGGAQILPSILGSFSALLGTASGLADIAGLSSFVSAIAPLQQGFATVTSMATAAASWGSQIKSLANDATSLFSTVSQLGGGDYGRYFNGRNSGFLQGLSSPYAGAASVDDLIAAGATQRAAIFAAGSSVQSAIAGLGATSTTADVAQAVQAHVAALAASTADPADGVRLTTALATYAPAGTAAPSGAAVTTLYQRAAVVAAARVADLYAPASADDATAVRARVLAPLDVAIRAAGNANDNATFTALRNLRQAVVQDLAQHGAGLPRLSAVVTASPTPAVVLADRRYGDIARTAELISQANPIHPLFMPTNFQALAS